jgi:hypothetical protein
LLSPDKNELKDKRFSCARYTPLTYLKEEKKVEDGEYYQKFKEIYGYSSTIQQTQNYMAEFITKLLVSRFESSISSFRMTLENIFKKYEIYENWFKI